MPRMLDSARYYLQVVGWSGLVCATRAEVSRDTVLCEIRRSDVRQSFYLRIPSSDVPTYDKVFLQREYDFRLGAQPAVIVDAGANIGLASIYFASKYPAAKIIAIEPEASNFQLLQRNVAPYATIVPVQAALWDHNGEIDLVDPGLGKWGFTAKEEAPDGWPPSGFCHKVTAITVDGLMDLYELERIDVLKIDIEGAEKEVFADTSAWIERVDTLIVELHERNKPGCNRSFYHGTDGFAREWQQGENVVLTRLP